MLEHFVNLLATCALLFLFISAVMYGVGKDRWCAYAGAVCGVSAAAFIYFGNLNAQNKGFAGFDELQAAQNAGVYDPVEWRSVSAERAKTEAARQAAADAVRQATKAREADDAARRDASDRSAREAATRQAVMMITAEQVLRNHLKDPGSADIKTISAGADSFGHTVVCGGVNAKNSFGGYTGMKGFVVTPETGSVEIEGSGNDVQFNIAWTNSCRS